MKVICNNISIYHMVKESPCWWDFVLRKDDKEFLFNFYLLILERGKEREEVREREKHQFVVSLIYASSG